MGIGHLSQMLHKAGIRPSLHRIAVLEYVATGTRHPSADEIYAALAAEHADLSRTTVYNALHLLTEKGLLRELEIESGCRRYDMAHQKPHSHFMCRRCGRIFDFPMPVLTGHGQMESKGFIPDSMDVTYKGVCPECIEKLTNCQIIENK